MTAGTGVRDFTLLLPPGWARIPLDGTEPLRVKQLVDRRTSAAPAEHRQALRTALTTELNATLQTARRQGGLDVLLSVDPVAGQPVAASALVSYLSGQDGEGALDTLLSTLVAGSPELEVQELDVVEVAGAPAVRRLSTRQERVAPAGNLPGGVLRVTQLEYYVPLPGGDGGVLVVAFSTPVEPLAAALVQLFDVMGTSLRWVRG